jgi:hypothetical protein
VSPRQIADPARRQSRKNTEENPNGEENASLLLFKQKEDAQEEPVSRRQVQTGFRSAATIELFAQLDRCHGLQPSCDVAGD